MTVEKAGDIEMKHNRNMKPAGWQAGRLAGRGPGAEGGARSEGLAVLITYQSSCSVCPGLVEICAQFKI